jgi:DNA-binding SARP family transcriptional activator
MLRLRTFGGLTLARGEEDLTGAVTQRRRLAILAALAVAGEQGMSRDKLQALLWPESDAARARHVLNQLLYAQRRQVGSNALFRGQKTLRLNPEMIWTDAGTFEAALQRGELEEAAAVYAGPFLDGFFLKDAPEFERWTDENRSRLARRHLDALSALAGRATLTGDHTAAAAWWRRALDADPYDSVAALGLVESLAASGDRPGALREGLRHDARVRAELGVPAGPRLRELLARLSS